MSQPSVAMVQVQDIEASETHNSWVEWLKDKLTTPEDSLKARQYTFAIFCACWISLIGSCTWAVLYHIVGTVSAAVVSYIATAIHGAAMVHILFSKKSSFALRLSSYTIVAATLTIHMCFGGGTGSPGVQFGAFVGPLLLVIFGPTIREGVFVTVLIVGISLIICILDLTVGNLHIEVFPARWYPVFFWLNQNMVATVNMLGLGLAVHLMRISEQHVHQSKLHAEDWNSELGRQQKKLVFKQHLMNHLIANIFPESVAKALIELFEKCVNHKEAKQKDLSLVGGATSHATSPVARKRMAQLTNPQRPVDELPATGPRRHHSSPLREIAGRKHRDSLNSIASTATAVTSVKTICTTDEIVGEFMVSLSPKYHPRAAILFADLAGFTTLASRLEPTTLVCFLDELFGDIDVVCKAEKVEKIKTVGDCYMCVGWCGDHATFTESALSVLHVGHRMHRIVHQTLLDDTRLSFRAGMHVGSVVSGIIGLTKFTFDVWGDAVNVASRMESTGVPGVTQVTPEVYDMLKDKHEFTLRGLVDVKGKGPITTYLTRRRANSLPTLGNGPSLPTSPQGRMLNVVENFAKIVNESA